MSEYKPSNQSHERTPAPDSFETTTTTIHDFDDDGRRRIIKVLSLGRPVEVLDVEVGEWK